MLLNDPIYVEAARAFAVRMIEQGGATDAERINWAFETAVSREASAEEVSLLTGLSTNWRASYSVDRAAAEQLLTVGEYRGPENIAADELAAWTGVARVILNMSETITRP